jgi:3-phosphoshikimate 1-carboxyvinyltransferase
MIEACCSFGAKIHIEGSTVQIEGVGGRILQTENVIDAGNSGIVLRFCTAVGALASKPVVITGDYSIRHQRPMKQLLKGLRELGVQADAMRGDEYAPVILKGPLRPGTAFIEGSDSQPVSALLIASAFAEGPVEIFVENPGEKPWVDMTLGWLDFLQIPYVNHSYEHFRLQGRALYNGFDYAVPGDLSSAAFPIAAALITGSELLVKNIDLDDSQGDKEFIFNLQKMGAHFTINRQAQTLLIKKGNILRGKTIDMNNCIDAITTLAVVGCFSIGETKIVNARVAREKECDRIKCMATELKKMGGDIEELEDGLVIRQSKLSGGMLNSYNDHRMAMSLALAAMGAKGPSIIGPVDCVGKTFPTFARDFSALGANIREIS